MPGTDDRELTLADLDRLEETAEGLALVRHTGRIDDVDYRVMQDVLHDTWTIVADDHLTPPQQKHILGLLPTDVVLFDVGIDALGYTTCVYVQREELVRTL